MATPGVLVIAGCVVLAGFGALVTVPRLETVNAQAAAQTDLDRGDPAGAITEATRALKYDSNNVNALVLRSAGFARFDAFGQARADLKRALRIEPENWATWGLLGTCSPGGDSAAPPGRPTDGHWHSIRESPA